MSSTLATLSLLLIVGCMVWLQWTRCFFKSSNILEAGIRFCLFVKSPKWLWSLWAVFTPGKCMWEKPVQQDQWLFLLSFGFCHSSKGTRAKASCPVGTCRNQCASGWGDSTLRADWWVPLPGPSRWSSLIALVYVAWHGRLDVIGMSSGDDTLLA